MMQSARSDPLFHAWAPKNKVVIKVIRTMITTVSSSRVIPEFPFRLKEGGESDEGDEHLFGFGDIIFTC